MLNQQPARFLRATVATFILGCASMPLVTAAQPAVKTTKSSAQTTEASKSSGATKDSASSALKKLTLSVNTSGIGQTVHTEVIKATANYPDEPPRMNGEPEHLRVIFNSDKLTDYTDFLQRQILVYPVQSYEALFHGADKAQFESVVSDLKKITATKSDKGIKQLPILPPADAFEVFHNQEKYINFKNGSGIAYLSCYAQDVAPIKNGDIFYTFQGLTKDGKYYVSLFYPVTAKGLPGGSPKKGVEYLSKLARTEFSPSLNDLDAMAESISLK